MTERRHLSWRRAELLAEYMSESYGVTATVAIQIRDGGAHPVVGSVGYGECRLWEPGHNMDRYFFDAPGLDAPVYMPQIGGAAG